MDMLEIKNLTVKFKTGEKQYKTAVDKVSFSVKEGEVIGIVGESGSGKSITALSILGLLPYPKACHTSDSSIKFENQELIGLDDNSFQKIRGDRISFIFQEPMSSLNPLHTVEKQIMESLLLHRGMNLREARKETLRLLKQVGIQNAKQRMKAYPFELSGGQRQRIMIAMAIANKPKLLIADEPTTALDVTVQEQILELLSALKDELKMSLIFISHDLKLIHKIADKVLVMKDGNIVEQGDVEKIFTNPQHHYTKSLIEANMILKNNDNISDEVIASVKNLEVSFPLQKNIWGRVTKVLHAVNKVSFEVKQGQTLGIVGESGSGKTTLGLAFVGLNKYNGEIFYNNQNLQLLNTKKRRALSKDIQIVFQDPYNSLNPRMNVEEIITEGLQVHFPNLSKKEQKNRLLSIIGEVGLMAEDVTKYPHEFSGGQRQRIAIARALILEPKLLILDEPTSALDVTIQAQIVKLLQSIQKKRKISYIFISHDMKAIKAMSDEIAVMKDGKIIELSSCYNILNSPQHDYTKKLISAVNLEGR